MASQILRVSLHVLLLIINCSCSDTSDNIIDAYFKTDKCSNPEVQTILRAIPAKTAPSFSGVHCAILCHRTIFCKYAIFNNENKTCEQIYGLSNTFRQVPQEYTIHDVSSIDTRCRVLIKVIAETWTRVKTSQLMMLKNHNDYSELKYDMADATPPFRHEFYPISQFIVQEPRGFTVATKGKIVKMNFKANGVFGIPYSNRLIYLYGNSSNVNCKFNNVHIESRRVGNTDESGYGDKYCAWKHIRLESDVKLANNIDEAMSLALVHGARRLANQPTTTIYDQFAKEIHFDNTEMTFIESSGLIPTTPPYFKSIKEMYSQNQDDTRYTHKYLMFGDSETPYETSKIENSFPLVFDTAWKRINGIEVEDAVRQGKSLSILLNNEMYTDIIMVYVTQDNIMVSMTPYIYPFKGRESQSLETHYIRYPLFDASNNRLAECQSSKIRGYNPYLAEIMNTSRVDWFVSTNTWSELLVINKAETVLSGSHQLLNESIIRGENIRVCVDETPTLFYCVSTHYASSVFETIQSYPFINPYEAFSANPIACPRQRIEFISAEGKKVRMIFNVGAKAINPRTLQFEKISWFGEK